MTTIQRKNGYTYIEVFVTMMLIIAIVIALICYAGGAQ